MDLRIEELAIEMYSQDCADPQGITTLVLEWLKNSTVFDIIELSIDFLTTKTNKKLFFFAATCIRNIIITRWSDFNEELNEKLILFLISYIDEHKESANEIFYNWILTCLADLIVLAEDFPINQVLPTFPEKIQVEICSKYFEEKKRNFFKSILNKSFIPVPESICEFVHNLLQNIDLSEQWIRLYNEFSMGYEISFQPFVSYIPKLIEVAKNISICDILIDHITNVLNKDMKNNEPDEYHFHIVNLSIELSSNIRSSIEEHPEEEEKLAEKLIFLWIGVLFLQDTNNFFLQSDFIQITYDLINEFIEVEKVLIESAQKSNDIDLWPSLLYNAMFFCDNFDDENCPITDFAVNVLEFVLVGLDFGVKLRDIQDKLVIFYKSSKKLFDEYFVNPQNKSPSLLLIIGYLNQYIPPEINELYCANFQEFNAPPSVQIYFSTQIVSNFAKHAYLEKYASSFINVFFNFFDEFPYECSEGFFLIAQKYSSFIDGSVIEHLGEYLNYLPYSKMEFLIPSIIILAIKILKDEVAQVYEMISQIIAREFVEAYQSQNKQTLYAFFLQLYNIMFKLLDIIDKNDIEKELNEEENKLFLSFGQQIFTFINDALQETWMDPHCLIQFSLYLFTSIFLRMNFVSDPASIANWLNEIIVTSPFQFHIYLIYYFKDNMESMPNIVQFIKSIDKTNSSFVDALLELIKNLIPEWDNSYWDFIPPDFVLSEILDTNKASQNAAIINVNELTRNSVISPEFKAQVLQVFIEGISTIYELPSTVEQADLILNLTGALGIESVFSAFAEHIPMSAEDQQAFAELLSSYLSLQAPDEEDAESKDDEEIKKKKEYAIKKIEKGLNNFLDAVLKRKKTE